MAILKGLCALLVLAICVENSFARSRTLKAVLPLSNRVQKSNVEKDFYFQENPPYPFADHYTIHEDDVGRCYNVLKNDIDIDEEGFDVTSLSIVALPQHGVAEHSPLNHKICYKPDADYNGVDSLRYQICDFDNLCEWAEVRFTILPINDRPELQNDFGLVGEDEYSVTVNVLANDRDVDGFYPDYQTLQIVEQPCHGEAVIDRNHMITYTPTFNSETRFYGEDSLVYRVCDMADHSLCAIATVCLYVEDKCLACEFCNDYLPTFNLHRGWLDKYYQIDVLASSK